MEKVLIGMSGGVDSSVAAYLLKKDGYEVIGATMVLFDGDNENNGCLSNDNVVAAKNVCDKLEIKHIVINAESVFFDKVISDFIYNYKNGMTPNPCVMCNKYLKFGLLYEKAKELGCKYIATGHYAKILDGKLAMASNTEKDQSYFLYQLDKKILPFIFFPLEKYTNKEDIRKIALEIGLDIHNKKDSQELCFIPDNNYVEYLKKHNVVSPKGNFVNDDGKVIGSHDGIINYTIGQRKGLGVSSSDPLYVTKIDKKKNEITLSLEDQLYKNELIISNINLLVDEIPEVVYAKIRFRSPIAKAKVFWINNEQIKVVFEHPQRAITKGQSVVFYKDNICLGGGIICL